MTEKEGIKNNFETEPITPSICQTNSGSPQVHQRKNFNHSPVFKALNKKVIYNEGKKL